MTREFNLEETVGKILRELNGYTVEQCELILKTVGRQLKGRAVLEVTDDGGFDDAISGTD